MQPYKWQESAIARFARRVFFCLAVDCGCGKTLAAILIALRKRLPVIVIAPRHRLCEQWKRDILDASPGEEVWVYSKQEETKKGKRYEEEYEAWLEK
jgi:superfamily II DNA or RNA helicase